jgi:prepilin-type N-terminal cleavage/methylation domain-containing protein
MSGTQRVTIKPPEVIMAMQQVSSKRAFSLMELAIVIIIVGILATIAIGAFSGPKENALEKEAKANLKLIAAGEKIYRMEASVYIAAVNETEINGKLRLMLPISASRNWNYNVTTANTNTTFIANAVRTSGTKTGTLYRINETSEEPY